MSFCTELVEKVDSDRYVLSLFAGDRDRMEALCAIYAFNYEIARIRESVTDTNMGLIRMQWWRDGLRGLNPSYTNEIMVEVKLAQARYDISYELFDDLMMAREFDLEGVQPSDLSGFYLYAQTVEKALGALVSKVIGVNLSVDLCRAYGVQGLLRAFVPHAKQGRCYLPEGYKADERKGLVENIVREQLVRLEEVRRECRADRYAKAMWRLSYLYLSRIQKCKTDVEDARLTDPLRFRYFRLLL